LLLSEILKKLIAFKSVTPEDAGCQQYMSKILISLGFRVESFPKGAVENFYAEYGDSGPLLIFAGHTDVVPAGDESLWASHPFALSISDGYYFGRGVADMKGSLASMLIACQKFVENNPRPFGRLGLLITSAEEGNDFMHGTPHVIKILQERDSLPDYCIVGEPSSTASVGDVIKVGRRGSLHGQLIVEGIQGHVAYPHLAKNPVHMLAPVVDELTSKVWDNGGEFFPPTSFQITKIKADSGANNVIPQRIEMDFNFRYSILQTIDTLKHAVLESLERYGIKTYAIDWVSSGEPFLTKDGKLLAVSQNIIEKITGHSPEFSTTGGTSDGRFIAPLGVELIELGPVNNTIHKINECVSVGDLDTLADIYYAICCQLLS